MIETQSLIKTYRTKTVETRALDGVDLDVAAGEFVAVMGPSGSGKSTLLNVLGLLDAPSGGVYRFGGEDVSGVSERRRTHLRREKVGFVFQNFNLVDELTVFENVELPLLYLGVSPAERRRRVEEVLERVGLGPRRDHFPSQLSGGQQQRAAVSRAVVTRPALILADEPTGNLDSTSGDDVMGLLGELHRDGATVVMVTHSEACARHSQRLILLEDGRISP